MDMELKPVGVVRSTLNDKASAPKQGCEGGVEAVIEIFPEHVLGLDGLQPGAELVILTWLNLADRDTWQVHPRGDTARPKRGVFATRSPDRPNPIGLHPVRLLSLELPGSGPARLTVAPLEALDGTPVVDVKPELKPASGRWTGAVPHAAYHALRETARDAWTRGLVSGFNSNLSVRLGENAAMTCSGSAKGRLAPHDVVLVDITDGRAQGPGCPSSESPLHLAVYQAVSEAHAIVHTHPPYLLAASLLMEEENLLDLPLFEARVFRDKLGLIPAHAPGTRELAQAVALAAKTHQAVFMRSHGLVVHGRDLGEALGLTEELESLARMQWLLWAGRPRTDRDDAGLKGW